MLIKKNHIMFTLAEIASVSSFMALL